MNIALFYLIKFVFFEMLLRILLSMFFILNIELFFFVVFFSLNTSKKFRIFILNVAKLIYTFFKFSLLFFK